MVKIEDYGEYETAWCPGCGNHSILKCVKQALVEENLEPHQIIMVSGIGQAAKAPHYMNANVFNGLHGRAIPAATGIKLANRNMPVIVESGDGCTYGEGGNHFLAALRRNINITLIVHDNQVYGLTKGQASPTSMKGFVTKAQPNGTFSEPLNPIEIAVVMRAGFVARGFSGMPELLVQLIRQGMNHEGLALIDVLQPCVSFNKINTFAWYKSRCYQLPEDYDPYNQEAAFVKAGEWGDRIPVGIIYKNDRPSFDSYFPINKDGPLGYEEVDKSALKDIIDNYR